MLFILFHIGPDRYALEARAVAEVLPLVALKHIPQAPPGVAGLFDYRGAPVPVIDLSAMIVGRAAQPRLSTRILLVHYTAPGGTRHLLGLIAEKATETVSRDPSAFVAPGVNSAATPYLGPVSPDTHGFIQRVEIDQLLPDAMRALLFQPAAAP